MKLMRLMKLKKAIKFMMIWILVFPWGTLAQGRTYSAEEVALMEKVGLDPEEADDFMEAWGEDIPLDRIMDFKRERVSLYEALHLKKIFKGQFSAQDALELKRAGVDFSLAQSLKKLFGPELSFQGIAQWKTMGINLRAVGGLKEHWGPTLSAAHIQDMHRAGVDFMNATTLKRQWRESISPANIIDLWRAGVDYVDIIALKDFFGRDLPISDAMELGKLGATENTLFRFKRYFGNFTHQQLSSFLREGGITSHLEELGPEKFSLDQVINLLKNGGGPYIIPKLKMRFPKLTYEEILEFLKNKGNLYKAMILKHSRFPNYSFQDFLDLQKEGKLDEMFAQFVKSKLAEFSSLPPAPEGLEEPCAGEGGILAQNGLDDMLLDFSRNLLPDLSKKSQEDAFTIYRYLKYGDPESYMYEGALEKIRKVTQDHPDLAKRPLSDVEMTLWKASYPHAEGHLAPVFKEFDSEREYFLAPDRYRKKIWEKRLSPEHFEKIFSPEYQKKIKKEKHRTAGLREALRDLFKKGEELLGLEADPGKKEKLARFLVDLTSMVPAFSVEFQKDKDSKDGKRRVGALDLIQKERDEFSKSLGYGEGHGQVLLKLQNQMGPGGVLQASTSLKPQLDKVKENIEKGAVYESVGEKATVRHLSLVESPFRGCLGGDCSSRTYFEKGLQENYHYFTLTDAKGNSRGHVTIVLGEAAAKDGEKRKVAFVDKIQGLDLDKLDAVLEAVRQSLLKEKEGYLLSIPTELGEHNGLTNESKTRYFVGNLLPSYRNSPEVLEKFAPEPVKVQFKNEYSRAGMELSVKPLLPLDQKGVSFQVLDKKDPWGLDEIDFKKLAKESYQLKHGALEEKLGYLQIMEGFYNVDDSLLDPELGVVFNDWIQDPQTPPQLKNAVMTFFLRRRMVTELWSFWEMLSRQEKQALINSWLQTPRYRKFFQKDR